MNGTLTATLYKGTFTVTSGVCTVDTAVSTGYVFTQTVTSQAGPVSYNTANTTVVGTTSSGSTTGQFTDGSFFWLIHYDDQSLTDPSDRCESSTISHNDSP